MDRQTYLADHESAQLARLIDWIEENRAIRFLDIGSNFGLYSLVIATRFRDVVVWSFEPESDLNRRIHINIAMNELTNVKVYPYAISDECSESAFLSERSGRSGLSRLKENLRNDAKHASRDWREIRVQTKPLDDLLSCSGERVALKIDVEGHEPKVILGMERVLQNNDCYLQVEINPEHDENREFISERLKRSGYELMARIDNDHIFTSVSSNGDGGPSSR